MPGKGSVTVSRLRDAFEGAERDLTRILAVWGASSTVLGSVVWGVGARTDRANVMRFGRQSAMWGAVDLAIAMGGLLSRRRRGPVSDEEAPDRARSLRTLLLVNAGADIGYMALGAVVLRRTTPPAAADRRSWRGMGPGDGVAIIVQGAFLLVLDSAFALTLTRARP
jgi:hypothetical protein